GAAAGFSIFVFLGAVIPVGILGALHLWGRGLRATLRDLPALLAGFVAGLAPLLLLNARTSGRGASFLAAKFREGDSVGSSAFAKVPGRVASYLFEKLPIASAFPDVGPGEAEVLSWIFALALVAATIAALIAILRKRGDDRLARLGLVPFV